MLHRSFKAAKCKTALKLAASRIKLLKNKRDSQVKQMKRELAQLLQSGQVQTARIRVEHVVREEKTMAAYDLIEIYCELIAARLPIIESQKNCPIDLKEAISGVIFASPRCSDVPELMVFQKLIASKYGKEFVSAAVELRPDCGVNRMLVEKLSIKSPDGPTKVKILSAIAKEHNVKWDPASFIENDIKSQEESRIRENTSGSYIIPPVQTQSGESKPEDVHHVKSPVRTTQVQAPPYLGDPEYPSTHISSKHDAISNKPKIVQEHKEVFSAAEVRDRMQNASGRLNLQTEPQSQEMDFRRLYPEEGNTSFGGQNWNMNFKDAASAAQAAAESAELASMAARAAAELSRQGEMAGHYAVGSSNSTAFGKRDEPTQQYTPCDSNHLSSNKSDNGMFYSSHTGVLGGKIDRDKQENLVGPSESSKRRDVLDTAGTVSHSASSNFGSAFVNENPFGHQVLRETYTIDSYPKKNSFSPDNDGLSSQTNMQRQYGRSEVDFVTELDHDSEPQKMNHVEHAAIRRQASRSSSHSQSTHLGDNFNDALQLSRDKIGKNAVNDLFVTDEGNSQGSFKEKSPNDNSYVMFDDSGSDEDDYETGSNSHASALGGGSSVHHLESTNSLVNHKKVEMSTSESHFSPEQHSHPMFTEDLSKSSVFSPHEESFDGAFDDSDGLSAGSEEDDLCKSKLVDNVDHGVVLREENDSSKPTASVYHELRGSPSTKEKMDFNIKPRGKPSPDDLDNLAKHPSRNRRIDSTVVHRDKLGLDSVPKRQPPGFDTTDRQSPDTSEDRLLEEPRSDNGMELNFGTLSGGLRNKGYSKPPYSKKLLSKNSSSSSNTSVKIEESSSSSPSVSSGALFHAPYIIETCIKDKNGELRSHSTYSDSDEEDLGGLKSQPNTSIGGQNTPSKKMESGVTARSSSRASISVGIDFESESSPRTINKGKKLYSQEVGTDMSEVSNSRVSMFGSVDTEHDLPKQTSESRFHPLSGVSRRTRTAANTGQNRIVKDNHSPLASASSDNSLRRKSSSSIVDQQNLPPQMKATSHLGSSEVHGSGKHLTLRRSHEPRSSHEENRNTSTVVKSSTSLPKIGQTRSTEYSESTDAGEDTPSVEKASHVHPKLPDYDSFAAHFQSLRRQ